MFRWELERAGREEMGMGGRGGGGWGMKGRKIKENRLQTKTSFYVKLQQKNDKKWF